MNSEHQQPSPLLTSRLRAWLELMRPANIVTAFADIMAGVAAAGGMIALEQEVPGITWGQFVWLLTATFGLYGGGVVFNDVFDAQLDAEERPERAIPSGRVTQTGATILGTVLLLLGIYAAFQVSFYSGVIALSIAVLAIAYDAWAKEYVFWGPLFMGLCRGGNLLLGCSILPEILPQVWYLAFVPVVYIASITLISRGEVHGGSKTSGMIALVLVNIVTLFLILLAFILPSYQLLSALPFIALFGFLMIPSYVKAVLKPQAEVIKSTVKKGVLSLIVVNSAIAGGFAGIFFGISVLILLPLSFLLSKLFSVT